MYQDKARKITRLAATDTVRQAIGTPGFLL
jgi:hypothetical protein